MWWNVMEKSAAKKWRELKISRIFFRANKSQVLSVENEALLCYDGVED